MDSANHTVNSSPPSAAYMRPWTGSTLVQVMACRLFGAKPLPEPMLPYCQLDPWEQTHWHLNQNTLKLFIRENTLENFEMRFILSSGRWVILIITINECQLPATSAFRSFTVSPSCRDSLARTSGSRACSTVDLDRDLPVCELRTLTDTKALGYFASLAGAAKVILYTVKGRIEWDFSVCKY